MKKLGALFLTMLLLFSGADVMAASGSLADDLKCIYMEDFRRGAMPTEIVSRAVEATGEKFASGGHSLKITPKDGSLSGLINFHVPELENHKTYLVKAVVSSDNSADASFLPYFLYGVDGKFQYTYATPQVTYSIGNSWGELAAVFTIDAQGGRVLDYPRLFIDIAGEVVYLDQLSVYEISSDRAEEHKNEWAKQHTPISERVNEAESKAVEREIYVDANAAQGGDGSEAKPFATIAEARDFVRSINGNMKGDIIVWISGGTYFQETTLQFNSSDSGTNGFRIIYRAKPNEEVVISGGKRITGMRPSEIEGVWSAPCDADIFRNLYVNDKRAVRARLGGDVQPLSFWDDETDDFSKKDGFVIPKGIIKDPENAEDMEVFRLHTFHSEYYPVKSVFEDENNTILSMEQPALATLLDYLTFIPWDVTSQKIRLENALEFLDSPGEWYFDKTKKVLYYMPREGESMESAEIYIPQTEKIVDIVGDSLDNRAENITFSGLTFAHGAYRRTSEKGFCGNQATHIGQMDKDKAKKGTLVIGNISLINAKNIRFENNVFKHMDATGLDLREGNANIEIEGNVFRDSSASAISVGADRHVYVADKRMVCTDTQIANNVICESGMEYNCCPAITCYYVTGLNVVHNEIFDSMYTAISVGWGWSSYKESVTCQRNNVSYNNIYRSSLICKDSANIYTLGAQPDSVVSYNYLHDTPMDVMTLYHDEGSAYYNTHHNVAELDQGNTNFWMNIWENTIHDITMSDNYVGNPTWNNQGTNIIEKNTTFVSNNSWPEEAREIILDSGVSSEYKAIFDKLPDYPKAPELQRINILTDKTDSANPATIKSGDTLKLRILAEYENGSIKEIDTGASFQVKDDSIISISGNEATAKASGAAMITAEYAGKTAVLHVLVDDEAKELELISPKSGMSIGDQVKLKYVLHTKYWTYTAAPEGINFTSDRDYIVAVTEDGVASAKRNGCANISATCSYLGKKIESRFAFSVSNNVLIGVDFTDAVLPVGSENVSFYGFDASGTKVRINNEDVSLSVKKLDNAEFEMPETYGKEMAFLYQNGYIDAKNVNEVITEKEFVELLSKITARSEQEILPNASDALMTREKMAVIAASTLMKIYGELDSGNNSMPNILDLSDITPEYIPYVSLGVKYEVFNGTKFETYFRPKDIATIGEAAYVVYRILYPRETYGTNSQFIYDRDDSARQMAVTGEVQSGEAGAKIRETLDNPGLYEMSIMANYAGITAAATRRLLVHNGVAPTKLNAVSIGNGDGSVIEKDGHITLTARNDDSWNQADDLTFAYEETNETDMEVSAVIHSVSDTNFYVGGGLEIRGDGDADAVNVNYRVRPNGTLLFVWRAEKGGLSDYKQIADLKFPFEIKLVKKGNTVSGYYKTDGDEWKQGGSISLNSLSDNCLSGLMLYGKYPDCGLMATAEFSDYYCGSPRDMKISQENE